MLSRKYFNIKRKINHIERRKEMKKTERQEINKRRKDGRKKELKEGKE